MSISPSITEAPTVTPGISELFNDLAEANAIKVKIESLQGDLSLLQGQFMHPGRNHLDIFAAHNLVKHNKFNDLIFRADTLVEGIEKRQKDKEEGKPIKEQHIRRAIKESKALDAAFTGLADELAVLKKNLEDRCKDGYTPFQYPPGVFFNFLRDSVPHSATPTPEISTSINNSEPAPPVSIPKRKKASSRPKVKPSIVQSLHAKSPSPLRQAVNAEVTSANSQKASPLNYTESSSAHLQNQNQASEPPSFELSNLGSTPSGYPRKSSRVAKLPKRSYACNSDSDSSLFKVEDTPRPAKKPTISKKNVTVNIDTSSSGATPQRGSEAHTRQLEIRLAAAENMSRELSDNVDSLKKERLKMKKERVTRRNEIKDLQGEIRVLEQQVTTLSNNLRGRENYYQPPNQIDASRLEKRKTQRNIAWGGDNEEILAEGGKRRRES